MDTPKMYIIASLIHMLTCMFVIYMCKYIILYCSFKMVFCVFHTHKHRHWHRKLLKVRGVTLLNRSDLWYVVVCCYVA